MRFFIVALTTLAMSDLFAVDYVYLNNTPSCTIKKLIDGKLYPTPKNEIINVPLLAREYERSSKFIKFKIKDQIYVATLPCAQNNYQNNYQDNYPDTYQLSDESIEREIRSEPDYAHKQFALNLNNYFIELGGGITHISDQNQIPLDYNTLFPSDPANPISWSEADKSPYKTKTLISIGFGIKKFDNGFFAVKIKSFKGEKVDTLSSTNINTGTTVTGSWNYSEALTSYYIGYKHLFKSNSAWKPTLSFYLGMNSGTTNLSDGTTAYSFTSLGVTGLTEAGVEYFINANIGLSINLGYEYIGSRILKPTDPSGTAAKSQTKLNYSNISGTLGIKSYF